MRLQHCYDFPLLIIHRQDCGFRCTPVPGPNPQNGPLSSYEESVLTRYLICLATALVEGALEPDIAVIVAETFREAGMMFPFGGGTAFAIPLRGEEAEEVISKVKPRQQKRANFWEDE